jgi:hypothetical protein
VGTLNSGSRPAGNISLLERRKLFGIAGVPLVGTAGAALLGMVDEAVLGTILMPVAATNLFLRYLGMHI